MSKYLKYHRYIKLLLLY